jgi:hypothetical protein
MTFRGFGGRFTMHHVASVVLAGAAVLSLPGCQNMTACIARKCFPRRADVLSARRLLLDITV